MKPEVRKVVILWALITVVGITLAFLVAGIMPSAASNHQDEVRLTMVVFTIISAPDRILGCWSDIEGR